MKKNILSGISWAAFSQIGRQAIQLISAVMLARILSPADFGVVAMAAVVTGFIAILSDFGISAVVIRSTGLSQNFLSSIFWLNVGLGTLLMLAITIFSPWVAQFYHDPAITPVLIALSATFPIIACSVLQKNLFEKSMQFEVLTKVELFSTLVGTGVGVAMAFAGGGVWSLVGQTIVTVLITTVLLWHFSEWRPSLTVSFSEIKSIGSFSANLTGFNILNFFSRNADNVLIGRFLGSQELGYYTIAYRSLMFPLQNLSAVIGRVVFPAFSKVQDDDRRLGYIYLNAIGAVAFFTFPLMLFIAVMAETLVEILFGTQWRTAAVLLMIFAPAGLIQSVCALVGPVYLAKGRADLLFKWGVFSGPMIVLSFVIGLKWGLTGVALCYTAVNLLLAYPCMAIPLRLINLSMKECMKKLCPPLVCASIMAALVWYMDRIFFPVQAESKILIVNVVVGMTTYLALSFMINRPQLRTFMRLITEKNLG